MGKIALTLIALFFLGFIFGCTQLNIQNIIPNNQSNGVDVNGVDVNTILNNSQSINDPLLFGSWIAGTGQASQVIEFKEPNILTMIFGYYKKSELVFSFSVPTKGNIIVDHQKTFVDGAEVSLPSGKPAPKSVTYSIDGNILNFDGQKYTKK